MKPTDFVKITAVEMESIPAGDNPFDHDQSNMGTSLVRGWMVMHCGYDSEEWRRPLSHVYLVNTRSGQRIKLEIEKK